MAVKWMGDVPENCDICNAKLTDTFIDGRVSQVGSWAMMCSSCHKKRGVGLGTGQGQKYKRADNGDWIKVDG